MRSAPPPRIYLKPSPWAPPRRPSRGPKARSDMVRIACFLSLLAAACAFPLCGAEKAPPPSSSLTTFGEAVEVNVVNVEVYVTEKDGKRVNDLKREDFTVFEDGK